MAHDYRKYTFLAFLLAACTLVHHAFGQTEQGKPFIHSYSYKEYHGHPQNFQVIQDSRGIIYVANYAGVLEYDGSGWRQMPLPNESYIAGLAAGHDGKIYVSGIGEVGYLAPNTKGKLNYYSLNSSLSTFMQSEAFEFRNIIVAGDTTYFFDSFKMLMLVRGKFHEYDLTSYASAAYIDGTLVVPNSEGFNLAIFKDGKVKEVPGAMGILPQDSFIDVIKVSDSTALIFYQTSIYEVNWPLSLNTEKPNVFKKVDFKVDWSDHHIMDALYLGDGTLAIASAGFGVHIMTLDGKVQRVLDKSAGLKDNYVWSMLKDSQGILWMALDNGIARTDIKPAFSFWDDSRGLKGYIMDVLRFEGTLYVTTSSGFYYLEGDEFKEIKNSGIESHNLLEFKVPGGGGKSLLLMGGMLGLHSVKDKEAKQLFDSFSNLNAVLQSRIDSNVVYIANENLYAIRFEQGEWKYFGETLSIGQSVNGMEESPTGDLWLQVPSKDLVRVPVAKPGKIKGTELKLYNQLPLPHSQDGINIFYWDAKIYFGTGKGIWEFDSDKDKFFPSEYFGERYSEARFSVNKVSIDRTGSIWMSLEQNNTRWSEASLREMDGGKAVYRKDSISLVKLYNNYIEAIHPDDDGIVWFGGPDALFKYNAKIAKDQPDPYPTLIRRVVANKDSVLFYGTATEALSNKILTLPYSLNSLTFEYTLPSYMNEEAIQFSYSLQGYDKYWSEWSNERKKEYTNLGEGDYVFMAKARDTFGKESAVVSYRFSISPPWYRTWPAIIAYLLLLAAIVGAGISLNTRRLQKDKVRLAQLVQERTKEVVFKNSELEKQKEEILRQAENLRTANESVMHKNMEIEHQKSEIVAQHDILADQNKEIILQRDKIEDAYRNVTVLSEIGQDITSHLRVEDVIDTVYRSVNTLMDAAGFGIGIFNERMNRLDFPGYIEKGEKLPFHFNTLSTKDSLSAWCFLSNAEIIINNYQNEITKFLPTNAHAEIGEVPLSIIYLPLVSKGKPIGVITVQSFSTYAYARYQIDMLRNIAIYTGIALENASVYLEIAHKNRKITDSINYAQNIQRAMLPTIAEIKSGIPDSFVLFQPRDIVSGDFYWFAQQQGKSIIAAVDCTGHGVPGAFMSLVGDGFLKQIVKLQGIISPELILQELNINIQEALHNNRDGMDMSICVIDHANGILEYAGARNPLVCVKDDELIFIRGDKSPIGGRNIGTAERVYTKHTLALNSETTCFIYTDGYQDQFGGEQDTKLSRKNFHHLLSSITHLKMDEQETMLRSFMKDWTGERNQIDDILVIGFRI